MIEGGRSDSRPVLVTGASGFVGSHIARRLARSGRQVRALLRRSSNAEALTGLPVEIVYGDALDPTSLKDAMTGCGTVFHSVVDARVWLTDPTPMRRNNIEGVVNAMDAALDRGIERFVFTSTMGTLGLNPNGPVTEDIPFNWAMRAPPYILARREAEDRFLSYCREKGLPGIALCVANTYGPEDYQPTPHNGMLWEIASGRRRIALDVGQPTVDIRDVADAALSAERHGTIGARYIIANEYVGAADFYAMATARTGVPMPRLLSYRTALALAAVAHRWSKLIGRKDHPLNPDAVFLARVFGEMDNGKARRELHWRPRPLSQTVADAVGWFAAREAERGVHRSTTADGRS